MKMYQWKPTDGAPCQHCEIRDICDIADRCVYRVLWEDYYKKEVETDETVQH